VRLQAFGDARILNRLELLKDAAAGQLNRFFLLLSGGLLRRKSLFRFTLRAGGGLLLLHRFAFPSSGHDSIVASADPMRFSSFPLKAIPGRQPHNAYLFE